ncbi:hypothetical protein Tdes44962_MAKER07971 [Teratosphaeria destructans]|uniref:Uncharacterized protein n=1 Tax=Teratosphaeria destructans TaxID=418781 RepID=A0A9W7SXG0_9PEZI|nr:hypothetical protein Tdes44962_MAKER07971 [Teratosphaeria destructans]
MEQSRQQDDERYGQANAVAALRAGHNRRVPRRPKTAQDQILRSGLAASAIEVPSEAIQYYQECRDGAKDQSSKSLFSECADTTALATYGKTAWQFATKQERRNILAYKLRHLQLPDLDMHAKKELQDRIDDLGDPEESFDNGRGKLDSTQPILEPDTNLEAQMQGVHDALFTRLVRNLTYAPDAGNAETQALCHAVQRIMSGIVNVPFKLQIATYARVVFPQRDLGHLSPTMKRFVKALDVQLARDGLVERPNELGDQN